MWREAEERVNKWLSSHFGLLARSATKLFHLSSQVFMAAFFSLSNRALYLQEKRHPGQPQERGWGAGRKYEGISDACRNICLPSPRAITKQRGENPQKLSRLLVQTSNGGKHKLWDGRGSGDLGGTQVTHLIEFIASCLSVLRSAVVPPMPMKAS